MDKFVYKNNPSIFQPPELGGFPKNVGFWDPNEYFRKIFTYDMAGPKFTETLTHDLLTRLVLY